MSSEYNPSKIEKKWQEIWEKEKMFQAQDFSDKPKFFLLVEFPYPSGVGLHVGHCRSYTALDVIARKKRMQAVNVLFPMGWDAFGLPSENYAIKTGIHPSITTKQSIETFKKQEKSMGFSFDWTREINTTDPNYYKWTQWIFLKLFENGLAYKAKMPINWCLSCKIGLANEEVVDGKCERCGGEIEKREKEQWLIKITQYAQRLIDDLTLVDFPERVKAQQKEWIGISDGWEIDFGIKNQELRIKVFTTRLDTLFGCTYLVVAPEHEIVKNKELGIKNYEEVKKYVEQAKKKSELERQVEVKEKTGVKIEGITAINPANGKEIPIFVADYVLAGYGTGAIMAVPKHDRRDCEFAFKNYLPLIPVVLPQTDKEKDIFLEEYSFMRRVDVTHKERIDLQLSGLLDKNNAQIFYTGEGVLINSEQFNGMRSEQAREEIGQWLAKKGLAKKQVNYKLRDWIFSRQHYWGEPIPLVFCEKCGWQAVSENQLPVELPKLEKYQPTETGESPLATISDWVNTKCPKCHGPAKRETDTMPNWAGSNWYFMRYCDPQNNKQFASSELLKYWMGVDWYNGGMEHTTLHLLYSRFIYKFLWDIGEAPKDLGPEPYKKRTSHGMILAEGGVKMSKSKGNVINPDDVIKQYGADTLRVYEMFMGPFEQAIAWDTKGVKGVYRFLQKIWKLTDVVCHSEVKAKLIGFDGHFRKPTGFSLKNAPWGEESRKKETLRLSPQGDRVNGLEKLLHKTVKKVSEDIEQMKFNTAISALMILVNEMEKSTENSLSASNLADKEKEISCDIWKNFLLILSPFAPHIAEELYERFKIYDLGFKNKKLNSIFEEQWPQYDKNLIEDETINLIAQINGKVRGAIEVQRDATEQDVLELAKRNEKINKWLNGKEIKKIIFIPNKLINFVI